jgi:hypothetical protein
MCDWTLGGMCHSSSILKDYLDKAAYIFIAKEIYKI